MAYINGKHILSAIQVKYLTPNGTIKLTSNGTYNVSANDKAVVAVMEQGTLTTTTDATAAYQKSIPANTLPYGLLNYVGGYSKKSDNIVDTDNEEYTLSYTSTYGNQYIPLNTTLTLPAGTYSFSFKLKGDGTARFNKIGFVTSSYATISNLTYTLYAVISEDYTTYTATFTTTSEYTLAYIWCQGISADTTFTIKEFMLNKGSTVLDYQPYFEGIRDSAVTSVVSSDGTNTASYTIPSEVQALEGYGWGISQSVCNYIDFENKKFVQNVYELEIDSTIGNVWYSSTFNAITLNNTTLGANVGSIIFYSTNTNIASVSLTSGGNIYITFTNAYSSYTEMRQSINGTIVYYELATPIETDISEYLDAAFTNENLIELYENGTVTFTNEYEYSVPNSITYQVEEA